MEFAASLGQSSIYIYIYEGIDYEIKWKILSRAQPFSPITGVCGLSTQEKWYILFRADLASLNKREEIAGHCFHMAPALLKNS